MTAKHNRRQADRRKTDRRRPPAPAAEDAWLSAWGDPGNSRHASQLTACENSISIIAGHVRFRGCA